MRNIPLCQCALFDTQAALSQKRPNCIEQLLNDLELPETKTEYELALAFLSCYTGSADTYSSYRREIERFYQWCWLVAKTPIKTITRNQIQDYLQFVSSPPVTWISTQHHTRFIIDENGLKQHNLSWRPFTKRIPKAQHRAGHSPKPQHYRLSNKSMQAILATLSTFLNYCVQEEYLAHNPILLLRQKNQYLQKTQQRTVTRKLSKAQWHYVITTAEHMAQACPNDERIFFLMSAFYLLGLRISELAETPGRTPTMGDFAPDQNDRWWFTTIGKGNKIRDVAVPDAMLKVLKRYRTHLGLTPLPHRGEDTALLHKLRGTGGLGTRQIRNLVQRCFNRAIDQLHIDKQTDQADDLGAATVHWLRHTAISSDIEHRPREHVRDDVGHGNAATTEQYIDTDRTARHDSAKDKSLDPEIE